MTLRPFAGQKGIYLTKICKKREKEEKRKLVIHVLKLTVLCLNWLPALPLTLTLVTDFWPYQ